MNGFSGVTAVRALDGRRLKVTFTDGPVAVVDLAAPRRAGRTGESAGGGPMGLGAELVQPGESETPL